MEILSPRTGSVTNTTSGTAKIEEDCLIAGRLKHGDSQIQHQQELIRLFSLSQTWNWAMEAGDGIANNYNSFAISFMTKFAPIKFEELNEFPPLLYLLKSGRARSPALKLLELIKKGIKVDLTILHKIDPVTRSSIYKANRMLAQSNSVEVLQKKQGDEAKPAKSYNQKRVSVVEAKGQFLKETVDGLTIDFSLLERKALHDHLNSILCLYELGLVVGYEEMLLDYLMGSKEDLLFVLIKNYVESKNQKGIDLFRVQTALKLVIHIMTALNDSSFFNKSPLMGESNIIKLLTKGMFEVINLLDLSKGVDDSLQTLINCIFMGILGYESDPYYQSLNLIDTERRLTEYISESPCKIEEDEEKLAIPRYVGQLWEFVSFDFKSEPDTGLKAMKANVLRWQQDFISEVKNLKADPEMSTSFQSFFLHNFFEPFLTMVNMTLACSFIYPECLIVLKDAVSCLENIIEKEPFVTVLLFSQNNWRMIENLALIHYPSFLKLISAIASSTKSVLNQNIFFFEMVEKFLLGAQYIEMLSKLEKDNKDISYLKPLMQTSLLLLKLATKIDNKEIKRKIHLKIQSVLLQMVEPKLLNFFAQEQTFIKEALDFMEYKEERSVSLIFDDLNVRNLNLEAMSENPDDNLLKLYILEAHLILFRLLNESMYDIHLFTQDSDEMSTKKPVHEKRATSFVIDPFKACNLDVFDYLRTLPSGYRVLVEIHSFYCNICVFSPQLISRPNADIYYPDRGITPTAKLIFQPTKDLVDFAAIRCKELMKLFDNFGSFYHDRHHASMKSVNMDYLLRGPLLMLYKLLSGIYTSVPMYMYSSTLVDSLIMSFFKCKEQLCKLLDVPDQEIYQGEWVVYKSTERQVGISMLVSKIVQPKSSKLTPERVEKDQKCKAFILRIIEYLKTTYVNCCKPKEVGTFSKVARPDKPDYSLLLHDILREVKCNECLYADISEKESQGLSSFRSKVLKWNNKKDPIQDEKALTLKPNVKTRLFGVSSSEDDPVEFRKKIERRRIRFSKTRLEFIQNSDGFFYTILEEGSDINSDIYVDLFFKWISFNFMQVKERFPGYNLLIDENRNSWIRIVNSMILKKPIVKKLIYTIFFEKQTQELLASKEASLEEGKAINKEENDFVEKPESESEEKIKAKTAVLDYILGAVIYYQQLINHTSLGNTLAVYMKIFINLVTTLQEFAANNHTGFKEYVGSSCVQATSKGKMGTPDFLKLFYRGLELNRVRMNNTIDFNWFRITSLAAITEYYTGPCVTNQRSFKGLLTDIIHVCANSAEDVNSVHYEYLLNTIRFAFALFEGPNRTLIKSSIFGKELSPNKIFDIICDHLNQFWKEKEKITKVQARANKGLQKLLKEQKDTVSLGDLEEFYMKAEGMTSHPQVAVCRVMYLIMSIVKREGVKKYERFFLKMAAKVKALKSTENIGAMEVEDDRRERERGREGMIASEVAFAFLEKVTGTIEIIVYNQASESDQRLTLLYPVLPECQLISKSAIEEFFQECNIRDTSSKLLDLINFSKEITFELDQDMKLFRNSPYLSTWVSRDYFSNLLYFLWCIGFFINLFWLFSSDLEDKLTDPNVSIRFQEILPAGAKATLVVVHAIFIALCAFCLGLWFQFRYDICTKIAKTRILRKSKHSKVNSLENKLRIYLLDSIIYQKIPTMIILHMVFCILSYFFGGFFITMHLSLFIYHSKTTLYFVKSITQNLEKIFTTFIIIVMTIFCFSVIIGLYFNDQFSSDFAHIKVCKTWLSCLMYVLNQGLRNGGGVADSMLLMPFENDMFTRKLILNLVFFILVKLVFFNIFFGIIIDTFAELRGAETTQNQNLKDYCFICGYDKMVFEKQEQSFNHHIEQVHSIRAYIHFMIYILKEDADKLTGVEREVAAKLNEARATDWFPVQNTDAVKQFDEDKVKLMKKQMTELKSKLLGYQHSIGVQILNVRAGVAEATKDGLSEDPTHKKYQEIERDTIAIQLSKNSTKFEKALETVMENSDLKKTLKDNMTCLKQVREKIMQMHTYSQNS